MLREDRDSLTPSGDFSRRDFVRASVGSGFAAAVLPVMAQTVIKTDTTGLVAGEVTIPVGDFKMPAYRAAPAGRAHAPVVLVISEIFGVHEHIADVARRFAKAGYFAIAPELFVRQGDAGSYGGQDSGIPLDTVDKMKVALAAGSAAAKKSEFVVYPDAQHAFHADHRASYRKDAADDGWKRCLAWFKAQGVA